MEQVIHAGGRRGPAQIVDQDRGVKEEEQSADPALIRPSLLPHPPDGIPVPLMSPRLDAPPSRPDELAAPPLVEDRVDRGTDEPGAPAVACDGVDLPHGGIVELYM